MIALADLKTWLGVVGDGDDVLLADLEGRQVGVVGQWAGEYFGLPADQVEIHDGAKERIWALYTVQSLIAIRFRRAPGDSWEVQDLSKFEVDGRAIYFSGPWPAGKRSVQIEYSAGYAEGEAPLHVAQVVFELVARAYQGRGSESVERERLGDLEVQYRPLADMPNPLTFLPRRAVNGR